MAFSVHVITDTVVARTFLPATRAERSRWTNLWKKLKKNSYHGCKDHLSLRTTKSMSKQCYWKHQVEWKNNSVPENCRNIISTLSHLFLYSDLALVVLVEGMILNLIQVASEASHAVVDIHFAFHLWTLTRPHSSLYCFKINAGSAREVRVRKMGRVNSLFSSSFLESFSVRNGTQMRIFKTFCLNFTVFTLTSYPACVTSTLPSLRVALGILWASAVKLAVAAICTPATG